MHAMKRWLVSAVIATGMVAAGVVALTATSGHQNPSQTALEPLTVMTFNIRYGTANDGENRWANRRALLFDVIRDANADVIGLQEALDAQLREVTTALPAYAVVGVGRDDGRTRGEYAAILFRTDRFRVSDSGTFWFSDTPSVVASKSWGNNTTRICTWARFVDRDGRAFWHYNVHLDNESQPSRERSTAFLAERMAQRRVPEEPAIVTGDFNAGEDDPALATLFGPRPGGQAPLLLDTFRVRYPNEKAVGTFSGFVMGETSGPKIDYILVPPGTDVLGAAIVRTSRDGHYASDHFPVTAQVRLPVR
jgi:endonuclease/exonuclease/phosphatase family metal-dependent hydrolase